jgi:argininosuccinate lyase
MRERLGVPLAPEVVKYIVRPRTDSLERDFRLMMLINRAHAVMLERQGILGREVVRSLLDALAEMEAEGVEALYAVPGPEDLYSTMEQALIERVGTDAGGRLHTGRSRNDLGSTMTRMAARERFLDFLDPLMRLREVLIEIARTHAGTVMPGYTHLQPAQPTTLGHYLASVLMAMQRDSDRLLEAYPRLNLNPLGACAFAGTGFPVDRELTAGLLGFDGVVESTTDAVASRDYVTEVLAAIASLGVTISRLAQDMYLWCSDEWSTMEVASEAAFSSSIMPQKKNPGTLEHIKAKAGHLIGSLMSSLTVQKGLNFMHCRDMSHESVDPLWESLTEAEVMITLMRITVAGVQIDGDLMLKRAAEDFSTATELADLLVRDEGLPFRTAHTIVGHTVASAIDQGLRADGITSAMIEQAAVEVSGQPVRLSAEQVAAALDPVQNLANKKASGSPSRSETIRLIDLADASVARHREMAAEWRRRQERASEELDRATGAIS